MAKINLPDGTSMDIKPDSTCADVAINISEGLLRAAVAAKIDDKIIDLNSKINTKINTIKTKSTTPTITILTFKDKEGKDIFWHSSAHILALAVKRLFNDVKIAIGPSIENGFYYDFDKKPFTPEDIEKIEAEVKNIIKENLEFKRKEVSKSEALKIFKDEPYKIELIKEIADNETISTYSLGDFTDLCRGPHLPSTKSVKAFKIMKNAGAYWKGNSNNKQLQRLYGISFPDKKLMKEHLTLLEEAEKRDHRKIGKELNLYSFQEEAPGMPFFHDKGYFIFRKLVEFMTSELDKRDYEINRTPLILNESLWKTSGHWDHYQDNMYFTKIDNKNFAVRPMNCPSNLLVYKANAHSYRELPIKAGEFGIVHRHELSGVLSGLFRVRFFTQDDAHVFCTEDQIEEQVEELLELIDVIYKTFGFEYHMELSTKPEKAIGDSKMWEKAESILKNVLEKSKKEFIINEGDGAFYGPKIDFHLKDAIGRTWQCGTIQLDFSMPERFDLTYMEKDGKEYRPVMLHRAIYGSLERFIGILVEHYAGKFPLWISPLQAKIVTISDKYLEYAKHVKKQLKSSGIRVELDDRTETIGKKIREAQLSQANYILVIGEKEEQDKTVNVRTRDNKVHGAKKVDNLIKEMIKEIDDKK